MVRTEETLRRLADIPHVHVLSKAPLAAHTRFGIGGPADIFAETADPDAFVRALSVARASGLATVVIGGGTNLIVDDRGFRGVVLKLSARRIETNGTCVRAESGAALQDLVDDTIGHGLKGLETMTGIPGSVGAAIYGNAGAYGHSISERARSVRFFDRSTVREFTAAECDFRYRESIFKRHKDWIIFSADLEFDRADAAELREVAEGILKIRNQKYPPTMKCAGSIFKNLLFDALPAAAAAGIPQSVIREGKVPSAYFLEQVGAKGMQRGDIHVAAYHANLIYNGGAGTAHDLVAVISELKSRVQKRFGIALEEEVQYVGFPEAVGVN